MSTQAGVSVNSAWLHATTNLDISAPLLRAANVLSWHFGCTQYAAASVQCAVMAALKCNETTV
jgi:hypothetical protein